MQTAIIRKFGVAILILGKIGFKTKIVTRDEEYFITEKSIHQEDITIISTYAHNNRAPKYLKQKLTELKGEVDDSKVIIENAYTQYSIIE